MNNCFHPWTRTTRHFFLKHLLSFRHWEQRGENLFPIFMLFQFQTSICQAGMWLITLIAHHLTALALQSIIVTKLKKYIKFSHTSWTGLNFTENRDGAFSPTSPAHTEIHLPFTVSQNETEWRGLRWSGKAWGFLCWWGWLNVTTTKGN